MNGKIIINGNLMIKRGVTYTPQSCPFISMPPHAKPCGDWCPLFSEPQPEKDYKWWRLQICQQKTLIFDNFMDERDHDSE